MLLAKPPPATISHDLPGVNKTIQCSQPAAFFTPHLAHDEDIAPFPLSILYSLCWSPTNHSPSVRSAFAAAETSCALGPSGFEKFPGPARPLPPPSTCSSTKAEAYRATKAT